MRRHCRIVVVGVLAALACGEPVGPPAEVVEGPALEVEIPPIGHDALRVAGYRTFDGNDATIYEEGVPDDGGAADDGGGGGDPGAQMLPLIFSKFATARTSGDVLYFEYGFRGLGHGYRMTPVVTVYNSAGDVARTFEGVGRVEQSPVYLSMRPTVEEMHLLPRYCSGRINVAVNIKVWTGTELRNSGLANQSAHAITYQNGCAPPPGEPGGGDDQEPGTSRPPNRICIYEATYDWDGRLVEVDPIMCFEVDEIT